MPTELDNAPIENLRRIVEIDDNIDLIRHDMKEYCKEARETMRRLEKKKKSIRDNISQPSLFEDGNQ